MHRGNIVNEHEPSSFENVENWEKLLQKALHPDIADRIASYPRD